MKKSISNVILMVAGVTLAGIMLYCGNMMTKKFESAAGYEESNKKEENFDDYTSNASISSDVATISPINSGNQNSSTESSSVDYQQEKIESALNKEVDLEIEQTITPEETTKLKETTIKNIEKESNISSDYNMTYYKINDNSYMVGVTNSDGSFDNYEYTVSTSIFGNTKYDLVNVTSGNSGNINSKLVNSEKNKSFEYSVGYENLYTEDSEVNKSFSSNPTLIDSIYESNKENLIVLNTYNNDVINDSATGFLIAPGVLATSWSYVSDSIKNGTSIEGLNVNKENQEVLGVISINEESDIALLKVESSNITNVKTGTINEGDEILLLGSETGFGTSGKVGVNIVSGNKQINSLNSSSVNVGSPLFNSNGEVVGMVTGESLNNDLSYSVSSNYLNEYIKMYDGINWKNIKYTTFESLAKKYYGYNLADEKKIELPEDIAGKYSSIGNLGEDIEADLVEYNNKNNNLSLRYLNDTEISSDIVVSSFVSNLKDNGYNEILDSNKKKIYQNEQSSINIYFELNYIIVVIKEN